MKSKMAADQVLKRFLRQIRKEDAFIAQSRLQSKGTAKKSLTNDKTNFVSSSNDSGTAAVLRHVIIRPNS